MGRMTEQEAIEELKSYAENSFGDLNDSFNMAIKGLEEVEKLRCENKALKNRCYILTRGELCFFCPIDCSDRTVSFRRDEDDT